MRRLLYGLVILMCGLFIGAGLWLTLIDAGRVAGLHAQLTRLPGAFETADQLPLQAPLLISGTIAESETLALRYQERNLNLDLTPSSPSATLASAALPVLSRYTVITDAQTAQIRHAIYDGVPPLTVQIPRPLSAGDLIVVHGELNGGQLQVYELYAGTRAQLLAALAGSALNTRLMGAGLMAVGLALAFALQSLARELAATPQPAPPARQPRPTG